MINENHTGTFSKNHNFPSFTTYITPTSRRTFDLYKLNMLRSYHP